MINIEIQPETKSILIETHDSIIYATLEEAKQIVDKLPMHIEVLELHLKRENSRKENSPPRLQTRGSSKEYGQRQLS
jgi:hypothetical protein